MSYKKKKALSPRAQVNQSEKKYGLFHWIFNIVIKVALLNISISFFLQQDITRVTCLLVLFLKLN